MSVAAECEIANYDDEKCIINPDIPADEEGNYVDCNTPEQIEAKNTRCCDVEGSKGCCPEETGLVYIGLPSSKSAVTSLTCTSNNLI